MIPYGRQDINDEDIEAVVAVLKSDFLTQGPTVPAFEDTIANYCNAEYATAVNSATSALHVACLALELGKGDILWTSPITFVASANCGLYCGADVDFVDIDPKTYNMSVSALEKKLIKAKKENKLPKIVIPVHLCGQSCEMEAIYELSQKYGFKIIEDASHAIGAKYKNKPVGSCEFSDITVFSFHPVKIITTGEGGVAVSQNKKLIEKMNLFRSHGVTRDQNLMTHESDGPWYYQQVDLGFNYRMTELQAALGLSQMNRLDEFVKKRQVIATRYNKLLKDLPLQLPSQHPDTYSSYHLYPVLINLEDTSKTHLEIFEALRDAGIGVNLHYIPVYKQPFYEEKIENKDSFIHSENYYSRAISLPLHPQLTDENLDYIVKIIKKILL